MTNKLESQSTEETEEQKRNRLARVHAAHTLNNTAVEVFICLRIPEGKLTLEDAKVISERFYVPLEDFEPLDAVEAIKHVLRAMESNVINALNRQTLAKERADDGGTQAEDGPVHE